MAEKKNAVNVPKSKDELRREQIQKRRKRNKRRRIIFYTVIALIFILIAVILSFTVFFHVNNISVSGKTKYTSAQIIKASGINTGDNLFLIDRSKVKENIESKLPYVGKVELINDYPDGIIIKVTAAKPAAAVANGSLYALITSDGKILELGVKEPDSSLMVLKGIADGKGLKVGKYISFKDDATFELFTDMMQYFKDYKIDNVTMLDLSKTSDIKFVYDGRITVLIGSKTNIEKKLESAAAVLEQENNISTDQKGTLDLTISGEAHFIPSTEEKSED